MTFQTADARHRDALLDRIENDTPSSFSDAFNNLVEVRFLSMKEEYRQGSPVDEVLDLGEWLDIGRQCAHLEGREVDQEMVGMKTVVFMEAAERFKAWIDS